MKFSIVIKVAAFSLARNEGKLRKFRFVDIVFLGIVKKLPHFRGGKYF